MNIINCMTFNIIIFRNKGNTLKMDLLIIYMNVVIVFIFLFLYKQCIGDSTLNYPVEQS